METQAEDVIASEGNKLEERNKARNEATIKRGKDETVVLR